MEHGIKNGTTNIHVSRTKLNKIPPLLLAWGVLLFKVCYANSVANTVVNAVPAFARSLALLTWSLLYWIGPFSN
jgi:hypothetical protein